MKYFEIDFTITPCSQDAQDILSALAGEAGCETFEETPEGLKAYVQQQLFDEEVLHAVLATFPLEGTHIIYKVCEAEDRDWNEQWEQEGFAPIVIDNLVIHDGRHLPAALETDSQDAATDVQPTATDVQPAAPLSLEIDAHLAFGTGTHETTRMICATLLKMDLHGKRVLDCGSGTGILGICALKLGAASCLAYDIDEWSADNTRHNAVINHVDDRLTVLCGDATVLDATATVLGDSVAEFHLVLANINRNILLQDLPRFRSVMAPEATLILSGFYESDCTLLEAKAQELGLTHQTTSLDGDWACMVFTLRNQQSPL